MTTWERVENLYRQTDYDFITHLKWHVEHGYVFAGPDYFIMGSDVAGMGWHVEVAVGPGRMGKFISLMPYYLPYIGFARDPSGRGEIVWYETDKLMRHL